MKNLTAKNMRSPKTIGFRGIFIALALLICPAIAQTTLAQTTATFRANALRSTSCRRC